MPKAYDIMTSFRKNLSAPVKKERILCQKTQKKSYGDYVRGIPNLDSITPADLILSASRALLCEIRPNMRKISIEYLKDQRKMILYFYYDSPPSQEELDYDPFGAIITEMSADFSEEVDWEEKIIVLPYPHRMPDKGICVYRRYEPSPKDVQ